MEMSTTEQQAQKAKQEMEEAQRQAAGEAKGVAQRTKQAAQRGVERLKTEKRPIRAAMDAIETAPKPLYLGLAAGSIVASLILFGFRKKETSLFVGQWAPTFLALGLFSELIHRASSEES